MKRFLGALGAATFLVLSFTGQAHATPQDKVWICHGLPFAASHDYNLIHVSGNAVDGEGKNDHTHHVNRSDRWDDIIPAPNEGDLPFCPDNQNPPTTTTVPVVTTTVPPTTTTTTSVVPTPTTVPAPTTTVPAPSTSTTTAPAPPAPGSPELPNTGAELLSFAVIGLSALGAGWAIRKRGLS